MAEQKDTSSRIITPIRPPLLTAIDDYRFGQRIASRAEAIRRLFELGLEAANQSPSADTEQKPSLG